jgi:hypothetical protein
MRVEGRFPGGRQARTRIWGTAGLTGSNAETVPGQQWGNSSATSPGRARPEGRRSRRPLLTSSGRVTAIQSNLNHAAKTDPDVLPKRQALEDSHADTPVQARNGADRVASGQVVLRKPGFGRRHRGSFGDLESGASRIFLLPWRGDPSSGRRQPPPVPISRKQQRGRAFLPGRNAGASSAKIR